MFLRGLGGNSAYLGQRQSDAIRNITGRWGSERSNGNRAYGGAVEEKPEGRHYNVGYSPNQSNSFTFNASRVVPVAGENRPVNYSLNYCIKY
ncbi:MAG: hypothetical protein LBG23_05135 [Endomicrobium sp.]|jgi:hypothetical protein|nr:hypothetical protein [Endomicrobium sp.]